MKNEAREGLRRRILVPVSIDEVKFPFEFRYIQAAMLIEWQGELPNPEFDLLVKSVGGILGEPQVMKTEDKNSPIPSAKLQGKRREKEKKGEGSTRRDRVKDEEKGLTNAMKNIFVMAPAEELSDQPAPPRKAVKIALEALPPQKKSVLLINDSNTIYSLDGRMLAFMLAFGNMGYDVKIEKANETTYTEWKRYDIVVWSCGDDYSPINNSKSKQMLIEYVDKGGPLILEGGNIAGWNEEFGGETVPNRMFREKVLYSTGDWVYHDVGKLKLKTKHPIATTPNTLPDIIDFTPTNPGDDSGDANAVRILPDAIGIYNWSNVAYGGKLVKDSVVSILYGLIAHESVEKYGGRIIYYAFDIDCIDSPELKQKLIQNSEDWLTGTSTRSKQ